MTECAAARYGHEAANKRDIEITSADDQRPHQCIYICCQSRPGALAPRESPWLLDYELPHRGNVRAQVLLDRAST